MRKLIQSIVVSTFAVAGAFQFIGCSAEPPVAEDPPEAAQEEAEETPEGGDGPPKD